MVFICLLVVFATKIINYLDNQRNVNGVYGLDSSVTC